MARRMINDYGMSEKYRNIVLQSRAGLAFLGDNPTGRHREYAETTQQYLADTVARIINERYQAVKDGLYSREELLRRVTQNLLEKETLNEEEFGELLGQAVV
ncbi:MAG: hypothetical protein GF344_09310 [Chitinivibrionales bacterium]|nr:hypothetical protein [Chitinivibrionales bacterium]MBD3357049.1 hypothetical protein [Chitinivibrionales bacterium]